MRFPAFTTTICAVFVCSVLQSFAQTPSVVISASQGFPQIDLTKTKDSCPEQGVNSGTRQRILDAAAEEWAAFRFPRFALTNLSKFNVMPPGISPSETRTRADGGYVPRMLTLGYMEDDSAVRARIGGYWASLRKATYDSVFRKQNEVWESSDGRAGWAQYWSAAFISYVMCRAGLSGNEFVRNEAHLAYIAAAVEQRDNKRQGYAYTAFDLNEKTPALGDLLCAAREDEAGKIDNLESFRKNPQHGGYHCDIVVGFDNAQIAQAGVVYAIGGNVINGVTVTETPINNGRLRKVSTPGGRNWFTILRLTDSAGAADFRKVPGSVTDRAESIAKARRPKPGA